MQVDGGVRGCWADGSPWKTPEPIQPKVSLSAGPAFSLALASRTSIIKQRGPCQRWLQNRPASPPHHVCAECRVQTTCLAFLSGWRIRRARSIKVSIFSPPTSLVDFSSVLFSSLSLPLSSSLAAHPRLRTAVAVILFSHLHSVLLFFLKTFFKLFESGSALVCLTPFS